MDLYHYIKKELKISPSIHELWLNLFTLQLKTLVDEILQERVHMSLDMYSNVVDKYCNMSAAQF